MRVKRNIQKTRRTLINGEQQDNDKREENEESEMIETNKEKKQRTLKALKREKKMKSVKEHRENTKEDSNKGQVNERMAKEGRIRWS